MTEMRVFVNLAMNIFLSLEILWTKFKAIMTTKMKTTAASNCCPELVEQVSRTKTLASMRRQIVQLVCLLYKPP